MEGVLALVAVSAVVLSAGAGTAVSKARGTPPFKYAFRITAFDVTATLTSGRAKTDVRLRLVSPSKKAWVSWFGEKPLRAPALAGGAAVYLRGQAVYSSSDPTCTQTLQYESFRRRPVGGGLMLVQLRRNGPLSLRVGAGEFPLAIPLPGQDGENPEAGPSRCGQPQVRWYEKASGTLPLSTLHKPGFTFVAHQKDRFEDPGVDSMEWTLTMKVERLRYHRIDCASEGGC